MKELGATSITCASEILFQRIKTEGSLKKEQFECWSDTPGVLSIDAKKPGALFSKILIILRLIIEVSPTSDYVFQAIVLNGETFKVDQFCRLYPSLRNIQGGAGRMDRKAIAERLEPLAASYKTVVEHCLTRCSTVFVLDTSGNYLEYYRQKQTPMLLAEDDLIGKSLHSALPGNSDACDRIIRAIRQSLSQNSPVEIEYQLDIEGHKRSYKSTILPIENHQRVILLCQRLSN